jgi:hypothetical protein
MNFVAQGICLAPATELATNEGLNHSSVYVVYGLNRTPINPVVVLLNGESNKDMAGDTAPLILATSYVAPFETAGIDNREARPALVNEFQEHHYVTVRSAISNGYIT